MTGALFEIRIDGTPRTYRDRRFLKEEGKSNREIARELGVDHHTIASDLRSGENSPESGENSPAQESSAPEAMQRGANLLCSPCSSKCYPTTTPRFRGAFLWR
jgi:hypothetical protein